MPTHRSLFEKMRIAYFTSQFPTLSEGFVINQIVGAIKAGHEVDIFTRNPHAGPPWSNLVEEYKLLEYTHIIRARTSHIEKLTKFLGKKVARRLIHLHCILNSKKRYSTRTDTHLNNKHYDIIHAQFGNLGNYVLELRNAGIIEGPILTAFRGIDITHRIKERGDQEYKELFKQAECMLPSCNYFKEILLRLGCPEKKIHVLYSGIDCARFRYYQRDFKDGPLRLLSLSRLVKKKGISTTLHALATVRDQGIEFHYTIAGDGQELMALQQLVKRLKLSSNVEFTGAVANESVVKLYNAHHIFLCTSITPSTGDQDGAANSPKEAAATGMPLIITKHGGLPEVMLEGKSSWCINEGDSEELAKQITQMHSKRNQLEQWSLLGAEFIRQNFDITALNQQMLRIYKYEQNWGASSTEKNRSKHYKI